MRALCLIKEAEQENFLFLLLYFKLNASSSAIKVKMLEKGELVVLSTLKTIHKFQDIDLSAQDKLKALEPLRHRVEELLFPSSGKTTWEHILDATAVNAALFWTEPSIMKRMLEELLQAGSWRKFGEQIQKPPFEEEVVVAIEYKRDDSQTGKIYTTDIQVQDGNKLLVKENDGEFYPVSQDEPSESVRLMVLGKRNKKALWACP